MRNTSTDGDDLSLITVWDCGIDGVETDLSLCLTHGASAAAIPTVHWEAIEINGMNTRKGRKRKKKGKEGKCVFALKKKKTGNLNPSVCRFPNIHNAWGLLGSAQSLPLITLKSSLSLKTKPFYHVQRFCWSQKHIEEHISQGNLKPHSMYTDSYINSSILEFLPPVCSIRSHFGGERLADIDERGEVVFAYISSGTRPKCWIPPDDTSTVASLSWQ